MMFKQAAVLAIAAAIGVGQTPIFRSGTHLIQVDVSVQGSKGPVRGLTKDDFTLQDKGKTQAITMFTATDSQSTPAGAALAPNIASNRVTNEGQVVSAATVLLYDRLNTATLSQSRARAQILDLLSTLKPTDRIAFYTLDTKLVLVHPFTKSTAALIEAAKQLLAQGETSSPAAPGGDQVLTSLRNALVPLQLTMDNTGRVGATQAAFRMISRHLDGMPGRKNLIWITSQIPFTFGAGTERREFDEKEFLAMSRALADSNVALYPVDPGGANTGANTGVGTTNATGSRGVRSANIGATDATANSPNTLAGTEGMQRIAEETGGKAYYNSNDIKLAAREILTSAEVTYTLGFYIDEKALDGKQHDLTIKLAKKADTNGAKVFHRKYYFAQPLAASVQQLPTMAELAVDEDNAEGIGVMAAAGPDPEKPGTHFVQVKVDLADIQLERKGDKWVGSFDLGFAMEEGAGNLYVKPINLSLTDAQLKQATETGVMIENNIASPTKSTKLRVVVQDKTRGSAG
ncbi:MAG: VWA domain-containing protein, partial [Acidobacteriota bacterium]